MEVMREDQMSAMAPIYGNLIVKGERDISNVPRIIEKDVKKWLVANGHEDLVIKE